MTSTDPSTDPRPGRSATAGTDDADDADDADRAEDAVAVAAEAVVSGRVARGPAGARAGDGAEGPERFRWRAAAAGMAARLYDEGHLRDLGWYRAVTTVPRHLLLPDGPDDGRPESWGPGGTGGDELAACYGVVTLECRSGGRDRGLGLDPDPGGLVWMLGMLGRRDRPLRVLQIGVGHGYLTALLCAGLGDRQVVVVDPDAELARRTGTVLGELGWSPQILAPADLADPAASGDPDAPEVPDVLGDPDPAGLFDGILVVSEAPRSNVDLWMDGGARWRPYLADGGRLILGPGISTGVGRMTYVAERGPDGQVGRLRCVVDPYPLTMADRLALTYLREHPTLTEQMRAVHVASGERGECRGCRVAHGVHSQAPCATRLLCDTAHAAAHPADPAAHPAGLGALPDPGRVVEPVTDAVVVDYLTSYPRAAGDVLGAHAADADGLCAGCCAVGVTTAAPCRLASLAEIAAARDTSIRSARRRRTPTIPRPRRRPT